MRIASVKFKRTKDSPWEEGVVVNDGSGPIIDLDGKVIPDDPQIWDYQYTPYLAVEFTGSYDRKGLKGWGRTGSVD